ncbi:MAG: hypothetical protein JXR53_06935 [Bacteroidales bacterium]|nr:hypothetical protein [Bacteroidales bacterium]
MEELIKEAVEKYMEQTIPRYLEKIIHVVEERLNLQTYSIREATKVTGIGYTKLYNAAMQGIIPSIYDGRTYKV